MGKIFHSLLSKVKLLGEESMDLKGSVPYILASLHLSKGCSDSSDVTQVYKLKNPVDFTPLKFNLKSLWLLDFYNTYFSYTVVKYRDASQPLARFYYLSITSPASS